MSGLTRAEPHAIPLPTRMFFRVGTVDARWVEIVAKHATLRGGAALAAALIRPDEPRVEEAELAAFWKNMAELMRVSRAEALDRVLIDGADDFAAFPLPGLDDAPTAGHTLEIIARFLPSLSEKVRLSFAVGAERVELRLRHKGEPNWTAWFEGAHLALIAMVLVRRAHWLTDVSLTLAGADEARLARWSEAIGVPVRSGTVNRLELSVAELRERQSPVASGRPSLVFEQEIPRSTREPQAGQLRYTLDRLAAEPDVPRRRLAREQGLSLSSFKRRLALEGGSISIARDWLRHHRAIELLLDRELPVSVIAERLGFSDDRAFRRAFMRWTGMGPTAFREGFLDPDAVPPASRKRSRADEGDGEGSDHPRQNGGEGTG